MISLRFLFFCFGLIIEMMLTDFAAVGYDDDDDDDDDDNVDNGNDDDENDDGDEFL
jgi:hypothetical protein